MRVINTRGIAKATPMLDKHVYNNCYLPIYIVPIPNKLASDSTERHEYISDADISGLGYLRPREESIDIVNSRIDSVRERNRKAYSRGNNNKNIYTPARNSRRNVP